MVSWCFAQAFCITYFLSLVGGWWQAQATVLWHGCFYVVRNVGVRAVYCFFKVHLSALKIFSVISWFVSFLLPIRETSREYFPSGWAFLPRHPAEVMPLATPRPWVCPAQSCCRADAKLHQCKLFVEWLKIPSVLASLTKPEKATPVPTEACSSLSCTH